MSAFMTLRLEPRPRSEQSFRKTCRFHTRKPSDRGAATIDRDTGFTTVAAWDVSVRALNCPSVGSLRQLQLLGTLRYCLDLGPGSAGDRHSIHHDRAERTTESTDKDV
jgi:hypothetical protein